MHAKPKPRPGAWPALLLTAALVSCSTLSTPTPAPPPVEAPAIPAPPLVGTPPPSGSYWQEFCGAMRELQQRLKITQPMSGLCSGPGLKG